MANLCAKLPLYEVDKGELDLTHMNQETRVPTKACMLIVSNLEHLRSSTIYLFRRSYEKIEEVSTLSI